MTVEEGQKVIEDFRSQGKSDEEIAGAFFLLFRDDKIDINNLEGLVNLIGYRLDDDFKAMSTEDQKKYGYEVIDEEQGQGQENAEASKEDQQPVKEEQPAQKQENNQDDEKEEETKAMNMLDGKSTPEQSSDEDKAEEEEARKLLRY